jgi:hypothetical protein
VAKPSQVVPRFSASPHCQERRRRQNKMKFKGFITAMMMVVVTMAVGDVEEVRSEMRFLWE